MEIEKKLTVKVPKYNLLKHVLRGFILLTLTTIPNFSNSKTNNINQTEIKNPEESKEIDQEKLIKSAVTNAIKPINSLSEIPEGGLTLEYPTGSTENLPQKLDFFPKQINSSKGLPFTLIQIGEKMFLVAPELGFKITKMYLDKNGFHVEVNGKVIVPITKTVSKNKEEELGIYIHKLYNEGEDGNYNLSRVDEVPPERQEIIKNKLEETNK